MATDREAIAQLARLLEDDSLRLTPAIAFPDQVDRGFERLADGLLAEAVASDDVIDRESALVFIADRLRFFGPLLTDDQRSRLEEALREKVSAW